MFTGVKNSEVEKNYFGDLVKNEKFEIKIKLSSFFLTLLNQKTETESALIKPDSAILKEVAI